MTAATADRPIEMRGTPTVREWPVAASTTIYKGTMVMLDGGYLKSAADTAGKLVVGVADEHIDNSAGSAGDKTCRVLCGADFKFVASSIAVTSNAVKMYVVDNQTFDETSPANSVEAGLLAGFISSTSGWLYIPNFPSYLP